MRVAFWVSFALAVYVYFGYPAVLASRRRREAPRDLPDAALPAVSLVIAAYNEAAVIVEKLENSLALDYPRDRLEIVVGSDGSTDATNAIVRSYAARGIVLREVVPRGGKTRALNTVVPSTRGDIVVLSDANTMYRPDAIRKLVRHFADPAVGCVSGDVQLVDSARTVAHSEGFYYRYERFIQQQESALGAIVGADGGMYAVRRDRFQPIRDDIVVDDFVISMNVARQGFEVRYEPDAIAVEQGTLSDAEEVRRKARIVAGGIQALRAGAGLPGLHQPRLLWCYASHKLLRWMVPVMLIAMLVSSVTLASHPLYRVLLMMQMAFYGAAAVHRLALKAGWDQPATSVAYYFCLVNGAAAIGLWRGIRGRQQSAWTRTRRNTVRATAPERP